MALITHFEASRKPVQASAAQSRKSIGSAFTTLVFFAAYAFAAAIVCGVVRP